jgi:hypothetical protein
MVTCCVQDKDSDDEEESSSEEEEEEGDGKQTKNGKWTVKKKSKNGKILQNSSSHVPYKLIPSVNFTVPVQSWKSKRLFWRKSRDFVSWRFTVVGFLLGDF